MLKILKRSILDLDVAELDWQDALAFAAEAVNGPHQRIFAFLNANNANIAMRDRTFFEVLKRSIVLPDGLGVDVASLVFHGRRFPANLNGTDFVPALLTYITEPKRIALLGARPEVLRDVVPAFERHAPWHRFIAISDGFFDRDRDSEIGAQIADARPDILIVAMGSPSQELWIARNVGPEHGRLVISVGALFDFVSGNVPRAPRWIRRARMEWAFRLWIEPSRLWRRYILGNPVFLFHVFRHRFGFGRGWRDRRCAEPTVGQQGGDGI